MNNSSQKVWTKFHKKEQHVILYKNYETYERMYGGRTVELLHRRKVRWNSEATWEASTVTIKELNKQMEQAVNLIK